MKRVTMGFSLAALGLAGCGGGGDVTPNSQPVETVTVSASSVTAPSTAAVPSSQPPTAKAAVPAATSANMVAFKMPKLTGKDLQTAQDQVQVHGILYSISHDLLGERLQVLDANWRVCSQAPAAGMTVKGTSASWEGKIDFGVVKLTETCP